MAFIRRTYQVSKAHDIIVKRVAKKFKISESEVIRRRIPTWKQMLVELTADQRYAPFISNKNLLK